MRHPPHLRHRRDHHRRRRAVALTGHALRVAAKAPDFARLILALEPYTPPPLQPGEALVEIRAAAVNPSDVKAALGLMPYAVFPRTPGRDFAGLVIDGPAPTIGRPVFGTSGDLGIRRDGSHATHLVVEADALVTIPPGLPFPEAAGIGVPLVTAMMGYRRAGPPKPGDVVLVMGVNGKVGQAAAQIATRAGARVIGAARRPEPYAGHASAPVSMIDSSTGDVAAEVRDLTGGHGADIVFNTVGDPYFQAAHRSLAIEGRQILIAASKPVVEFNIFEFYRGRHSYFGIDTLSLSSVQSGAILQELAPGFADGTLRPFPIAPAACHTLPDARAAYEAVLGTTRDRVILLPQEA